MFSLIYSYHFYLSLLSFSFTTVTLLYLFQLLWLILLLMWDACGRLCHEPKCFPSTPPSHFLWHHSVIGHARKLHYTICRHITLWPEVWGQSTGFSKEISPTAAGDTHMPCSAPSGKTPQPSALPGTTDRRGEARLDFPHVIPAGESWDRALKWFKHIFLTWSCRKAQDSGTVHQSGVDFIKYLPLFLGHFWTHRQHQP